MDILCNGEFPVGKYQGLSCWYIKNHIPPAHVTRKHMTPGDKMGTCDYVIDNTLHMVDFRTDSGIETCIRNYKREHGMKPEDPVVPHFLKRAGLGRLKLPEQYPFSISALFSCTRAQ
eukprot:14605-Eustigmatos_ZCMA.PRE.1